MIAWKFKLWRSAGAAAVLSLAACGEGGEAGEAGRQGAPPAASSAGAGGEAGEAAIGEGGGEQGEAGASSVYAGVVGDQRTALRIQHLRGFVMAAERMVQDNNDANVQEASILVQLGLLEVYEANTAEFGALDVAPLREAGNGANLTRAQMQQRLRASEAAFEAALAPLHVDGADLAARMVDLATGIYRTVNVDGATDPIEYKHSMGAALAARSALTLHGDELRRRNLGAYSRSLAEINRFVALWPSPQPPEHPAGYQQVLAQGSRVRLALSPLL
jgi:hypothetical protein